MRQFKMLVYCTVAAVGWSCGLLTNGQADEVDVAIAQASALIFLRKIFSGKRLEFFFP